MIVASDCTTVQITSGFTYVDMFTDEKSYILQDLLVSCKNGQISGEEYKAQFADILTGGKPPSNLELREQCGQAMFDVIGEGLKIGIDINKSEVDKRLEIVKPCYDGKVSPAQMKENALRMAESSKDNKVNSGARIGTSLVLVLSLFLASPLLL